MFILINSRVLLSVLYQLQLQYQLHFIIVHALPMVEKNHDFQSGAEERLKMPS